MRIASKETSSHNDRRPLFYFAFLIAMIIYLFRLVLVTSTSQPLDEFCMPFLYAYY